MIRGEPDYFPINALDDSNMSRRNAVTRLNNLEATQTFSRLGMREDIEEGSAASDRSLAIGKRLDPTVDTNTGPHVVHPERVIFEDVAHFGFVFRFNDP